MRKELLMVASRPSMRGFENVYVQKDLTYRQRQELSERRHRGNMTEADSGFLVNVNEDGAHRHRGNMTEADSGFLGNVNEDGAHRLPCGIADRTSVDAAMSGTSGVYEQRGRGRGSRRGRGVG